MAGEAGGYIFPYMAGGTGDRVGRGGILGTPWDLNVRAAALCLASSMPYANTLITASEPSAPICSAITSAALPVPAMPHVRLRFDSRAVAVFVS